MRRIVALVVALLLGAAALAEGVPGNRLGLKVLSELSGGQQNAVVSPVGLAWALSMAAEGAGGDTRARLLKALEAEEPSAVTALAEPLRTAGLRWASAALIREDVAPLSAYLDALDGIYGATALPMDADLDAWAREQSEGRIDGLPGAELEEEAALAMASVATMDAEWASPFDPAQTVEEDFHTPDGDVRVPFMRQKTYAQYGENGRVKLIRKVFAGGLSLIVALPPEGGLKNALANLAGSGTKYFTFQPNPQPVSLSLPKLDLGGGGGSLKAAIAAAGCPQPFDGRLADFSGVGETPTVLSDVFQRARICVDEAGTRAAAAEPGTAGAVELREGGDPIDFTVDRPFILAVTDRTTGAVLFAGAVVNPLG